MGLAFSPYFKLKLIDLSDDTQVNSGGATNTQTLQPDAGKIYAVIHVEYYAPDAIGSTAGTHKIQINLYSGTNNRNMLVDCNSNTGSALAIGYGGQFVCTSELPSTTADQIEIVKRMWASNDYPITFKYENNLDANQTGTRTLKILVKEYNELV